MIPAQTAILLVLLSIIPGLGCYREEQLQQFHRCESVCAEPASLCNDFIYGDCITGCMDKTGAEFASAFEVCVDCYVSVQCDAISFSTRCHRSCTF